MSGIKEFMVLKGNMFFFVKDNNEFSFENRALTFHSLRYLFILLYGSLIK